MAKSYGHTYERICDLDNIRAAIRSAAKGKRKKRSVRRALANEDATVEQIHDILVNHKPYLGEFRRGHEINDGLRAKKRIIIHPTFTEQIIDHCIMQVIEPHYMRKFYRWSCGSIPGRGQESMMAYVMKMVRASRKDTKYYAVLDVKKCFDSIDTDALYDEIASVERDKETLALIKYKLKANVVKLPSGEMRSGGVTIGTYTSPWLANIALDGVDHCIKDKHGIYLYVRFMDDMLMVHGNKREMKRAIADATAELKRFGLQWKTKPVIRKCVDGDMGKVRFCGVQITRDEMEIRDAVFLRARRTANRIYKKLKENLRVTWYDAAKMISYGGRFGAFESRNAFSKQVLGNRLSFFGFRAKLSFHNRMEAANGTTPIEDSPAEETVNSKGKEQEDVHEV